MAYEFKKLSDVNVIESISDSTNVLVEENGTIVKMAANSMVPTGIVKSVNNITPDETGNVVVSGLPEGAIAHQQLVTDANGVAKWEDRTHYVASTKNVFYEGDLNFYENSNVAGTYTSDSIRIDVHGVLNDCRDSSNVLLFCELDGVEIPMPYLGLNFVERWGNGYLASPSTDEDNGGDLYVEQYATSNYSQLTFRSREPGDYHVKLYGKGETIHTIDPKYLPGRVVPFDVSFLADSYYGDEMGWSFNNPTCNKTAEEVLAAMQSGAMPIGVLQCDSDMYVLQFNGVMSQGFEFSTLVGVIDGETLKYTDEVRRICVTLGWDGSIIARMTRLTVTKTVLD